MTGIEYVINQLGMALGNAEAKISQLQAEIEMLRSDSQRSETLEMRERDG